MVISIGGDHAGFKLKENLKEYLRGEGFKTNDNGVFREESCDYPDYALKVAEEVASGEAARGILICKTGIGMSIAANKVPGVRAALCKDEEAAKLSREHNNANLLVLDGGLDFSRARNMLKIWIETDFAKGRHAERIKKIDEIEKKYSKTA